MLLGHERNYDLGMDALLIARIQKLNGIMSWAWMLVRPYALGTRTELGVGHGCSGDQMLLGHEQNYDLGMDALLIARIQKLNGSRSWAWMLGRPYAFGTRTELEVGHGCSAGRTHSETEWNEELGMDARATVCSWDTNGIMIWAWMLC